MLSNGTIPRIGEIVKILQGRDKGRYAVAVKIIDERFIMIADGDKRKFDRAKRKNVLHIEPVGSVSPEVANSIQETGRVTNGKLRYSLQRYLASLEAEGNEEGK